MSADPQQFPDDRPTPPTGQPGQPGQSGQPGRRRAADGPTVPRAGRPTPPAGVPVTRAGRRGGGARTSAPVLHRLVGLARVLAGGLVALAVVVLIAPWFLGGPGPGADTLVAHVLAALGAVAATAVAAHRRTPPVVATVAAAAVPAIVILLFSQVWWA